ncbi:MAG: hypothetical protein DA408_14995 [Bacteroidetes bacterium]|nr:MAG: hypothetical protein C7N36_06165 [Bacteroidota bacterium]PTM10845.1 MAG: hypothetical protein DA408_14995 [Bacteroidota bacterium]
MQESKLLKSIQQLDSRDRQRFKTYVNSPYFNQHQKTIELLDYLLKHLDTSPQYLERQRVFKHLFRGEPYSEQLLFNTMSSLKKLFHSYLAQQHYEAQPFSEDIFLLESTFENNQFDLLKNRAKNLEKKLKNYPTKDKEYYRTQFNYLNVMAYYHTQHEDRSKSGLLQELNDQLDRYYLLEKLKLSCELTANQILMNSHFDFSFLVEVLTYYQQEKERFSQDKTIRLYYTILMSLREENEPIHYHNLKQMLREETDNFSLADQIALYSYANNYCVRQINKGIRVFQKELFELYQEGLRTELILSNGLLNEWNYKNITVLGCILEEFQWTAYFLETYKEKLPVNRQENSYNYNMAHLYFSTQRFSEALDHLLLVRFSDIKYHLSYNNLLLATYYSLGDTEALLSLIETFRIYVIRNRKMTVDLKKQYTNFLRFAKKLTLIKQQPRHYGVVDKEKKFARLYLQIQQSSNLVNRYWLEKTCREEAGVALETLLAAEEK